MEVGNPLNEKTNPGFSLITNRCIKLRAKACLRPEMNHETPASSSPWPLHNGFQSPFRFTSPVSYNRRVIIRWTKTIRRSDLIELACFGPARAHARPPAGAEFSPRAIKLSSPSSRPTAACVGRRPPPQRCPNFRDGG